MCKVTFGNCWKKEDFTLAEIAQINFVKKDKDTNLKETINTMISVLAGSREVIGYSLEWTYCRKFLDGFFKNVDIMVTMYVLDYDHENGKDMIVKQTATFADINTICNAHDREKCGYVKKYIEE